MKHRTARWMTTEGLGISRTNPWTGATWAQTGGRAYNTPTLGSELFVNGAFSADSDWTKGVGWAISAGVAVATSASGVLSQAVMSGGQWYRQEFTIVTLTAAGLSPNSGAGVVDPIANTTGAKLWIFRSLGTTAALQPRSGSTSGTVDDASIRSLTLSTLPATVIGSAAGLTVTAKPYVITTGTQAGVISHLDSAATPANFIIAYHDGTTVKLDKCVGGTYTNLVSVTVAFASDAVIEIRRPSGNTFQLWYNGTQRGTDQTISDAGIISNTRYGLFSTYSANTFSEFTLGGVIVPFNLPGV